MAKKPTISNISSGYASTTTLNSNFTALRDGFDNTLSLDGSTPNSMNADFDVNGYRILNAGQVDTDALYVGGVAITSSADVDFQTTYLTASYTGDGSTVAYSLTANPQSEGNVSIYVDGVYQNKDTFSLSGTTVTFSEAPPLNAAIEIVYPTNTDTLNGSLSSAITYNQGGTGAQDRNVAQKLQETVSVKDFGAVGDGVTDDTAAIQAALSASASVFFPDGSYLMNSGVSIVGDNIKVDFGSSTIINGGAGFLFTFGVSADTPQNSGLAITGGHFIQSNPATTSNLNYILVRAVENFSIQDCIMKNVSNGGICIFAGAENGVINNVNISGRTAYSTIRGIWLQGSTASDYSSQYVDTASITRNATAFATFAAKNIKITNCSVTDVSYGIYLMNAWDCVIDNCHIDISNVGAARCIAINNYSPNTRVTNCTLISDRSSTGILVTQASDNIIIANNVFRGSFGGNRAIYVAYLAQALISSNRFTSNTTQHIQIDMGGFAHVKNNEFVRPTKTNDNRAVYLTAIDPAASATAIGSTATVLSNSGVIFENNLLDRVCMGVFLVTNIAANNGNQPGVGICQVSENTFMRMDLATTASEYPLTINASSGSNISNARLERNVVYPYTVSGRNKHVSSGTAFILEATTASLASFRIAVAAGGGAITSTRLAGNNFSLAASRSGTDLILSPRTQLGASGASIPAITGIINADGATAVRTFQVTLSGANYTISAFDSTGVQISFATAGITFDVMLGPINVGT